MADHPTEKPTGDPVDQAKPLSTDKGSQHAPSSKAGGKFNPQKMNGNQTPASSKKWKPKSTQPQPQSAPIPAPVATPTVGVQVEETPSPVKHEGKGKGGNKKKADKPQPPKKGGKPAPPPAPGPGGPPGPQGPGPKGPKGGKPSVPPVPTVPPPAPTASKITKAMYGHTVLDNPLGGYFVKTRILFSNDQIKAMSKYLPGWTPMVEEGATAHTHGVSAFERVVTEMLVVQFARSNTPNVNLVDIGGNPSRHASHKRKIWSLAPTLCAADAVRNSKWNANMLVCNHRLEDLCNCGGPVDTYISIHSLYYLTPTAVLKALISCNSKTLYASVHRYRDPFGTKCLGEIKYSIDQHQMVFSQTAGNATPYSHNMCLWWETPYFVENGKAMAWSIITEIGDTTIYKFVEAPANLPPAVTRRHMPLREAVADTNYIGAINYQPLQLVGSGEKPVNLEYLAVDKMTIFSCGTHLIVGVDRPSPIPKQLLTQMNVAMAYKARNMETFQFAVTVARNLIKKVNVSDEHVEGVIQWAPVLAFSFLDSQERTLISMLWDKASSFKTYNELINFTPDWVSIIWQRVRPYMLGISTNIIVLLWVFRRHIYYKLRNKYYYALGIWSIWCYTKLFGKRPPEATVRRILYPGNVVHNDICYEGTPVSPLAPKAAVSVNPALHTSNFGCRPKHGATLCGISFAQRMPVQPRACVHNEFLAVRNRVTMPVGVTIPLVVGGKTAAQHIEDAWEELTRDTMEDIWESLKPVHGYEPRSVRYSEWLKRFPKARREAFLKARSTSDVLEEGDYASRKSFVKREFLLKIDDEGPYDLSPRLIQGAKELFQSDTGPWTLGLSKYVAKTWSVDLDSPVIYTSGLTSNELGDLFYTTVMYYITTHGSCVVFEDDFSFFDGSITLPAVKYKLKLYNKFHPPKRTARALSKQVECRGKTPHGVKYKDEAKTKSGDGDTSVGNTIYNQSVHLHTIKKSSKKTAKEVYDNMTTIVLGDDNLMITHLSFAQYIADAEPLLRQLGLVPKMKRVDDWRLAEYCSGWFYPSSSGYVYGPKIGRTLTKSAWSRQPEANPQAWAKAVALGLKRDTAHIPITRALVARVLELTENVDARAYYDFDHVDTLRCKYKPHSTVASTATAETFEFLYLQYGVTEHEVKQAEELIMTTRELPCRIYSTLFDPYFNDIRPRKASDTNNHLPTGNPPKSFLWPGLVWSLNPLYWDGPICNAVGWLGDQLYNAIFSRPVYDMYGKLAKLTGIDYIRYMNFLQKRVMRNFRHPGPTEACGHRRAMNVYITLIGPLYEEFFKHLRSPYLWVGKMFLSLILGVEIHRAFTYNYLVRYIPTAIMHAAAYCLPYWPAALLHIVWNVVATITQEPPCPEIRFFTPPLDGSEGWAPILSPPCDFCKVAF